MKYLIIGAGATGGSIGGFLAHAGKDVTFLARGKTKEALDNNGLMLHSQRLGKDISCKIKTVTAEEVSKVDVIFVCVKGYSLQNVIPAIRRACHKDSVVIPTLNIFGTGAQIQQQIPEVLVTDGCIYIGAYIAKPAVIYQQGTLFQIVYGTRDGKNQHPYLQQVRQDLLDSNIDVNLSDTIRKDTYEKFCFISAMAAAGAYYDVGAKALVTEGEQHDTYVALIQEVIAVGRAMEIPLSDNLLESIVTKTNQMGADTTTSLQKDLKKGVDSEIDGLIFQVVRDAEKYHVSVPRYQKVAEKLKQEIHKK